MKRTLSRAVALVAALSLSAALAMEDVGGGGGWSDDDRAAFMAMYRERVAARQSQQDATVTHVTEHHAGHRLYLPDALEWQAAPPSLPPGAEIVVLMGNPGEAGQFTLRLKWPAGYTVAPHMHPDVEHITVISGMFHVGIGETLDQSRGQALGPGGFVAIPAGHAHYTWASEETVIQLHSVGPWSITYVDPADDPRNQAVAPPSEAEELAQLTQLYRAFLRSQQVPAVTVAHE